MPAPTRTGAQQIELPAKFKTINDLLHGNARANTLVNIIGVVMDFRAPVATAGPDWKCQMSLYDHTTSEADDEQIRLNIFWPQDEMPDASLGDVVIAVDAKVQIVNGTPSLLTNRLTEVFIYSSKKIPRPPANASSALKRSTRTKQRVKPGPEEHFLASTFYHSIQKAKLPTEAEFEHLKLRSVAYAPGRKFSLLRNIKDQSFVDMVVQIVKEPFSQADLCSFWVSDYTEHDAFYYFAFKGSSDNTSGHTTGMEMVDQHGSQWVGPYGKRSLQVTCFEPHASFIRDQRLTIGDWVQLRNVHIKFGHNGANLEGFLREDRDSRGDKVQIAQLSLNDQDRIDPRLRDALARKRDFEKEKKAQIKSLAEAASDGRKRKAEVAEQGETKANSREKRRQRRAHMQQKQDKIPPDTTKPEEPKASQASFLNPHVKYEHHNKPVSTVREILADRHSLKTTIEGEEVQLALPFRNVNYRANVRVINFAPSRLKDFVFSKTNFDYNLLKDSESSVEPDWESSENDDPDDPLTQHRRRWEWRFFLELEDAQQSDEDDGERSTLWVTVDNSAAQCLIDLDASNLSEDADALEALRQRMFLIWGELEENKSKELEKKIGFAKPNVPPADSDDEEAERSKAAGDGEEARRGFINRPFGCCIKEYGFKVPEQDPGKADAGEGRRWQRAFALFGTRITD